MKKAVLEKKDEGGRMKAETRLFKKGAPPPDALKWQTCRHSDADGRCANPDANGAGNACAGCEDYEGKDEGGRMKDEGNAQRPVGEDTRACACVREGGGAAGMTAEDVLSGYVAAVNGTLHIIRFGCMMLVLDMSLTRETHKGGCFQTGETLKAWLAANVPDVNYKTAMRMKGTAEAVCAGLGFPADVLLRALNPDPRALPEEPDGERLIAAREALIGIVHGRSERSLVLWLKGGAPALPAGADPEDTGKADELALDAARRFGRSAADALKCLDGRQRNAMTKALAGALREALGLKGLAWLARVLEEAEGAGE